VTAKQLPGQLPTDCGPVPRLLYSVDEVAAMFSKAPDTIRAACWKHGLPYRLETTWGPGGRRFRRMVFSNARDLGAARSLRPARLRCSMPRSPHPGRDRHHTMRRPPMPVADLAREAARQTAGVATSARWTLPGASRVPDRQRSAHLDDLDEAIGILSGQVETVIAPFADALTPLESIPGINQRTAEVISAETGGSG
jgi:hypothetical protein